MGGGKNKGEKKEERNKNILIIATVARKTDLPPNSSVWIELQMSSTLPIFDIPRPPSLRIIIDCQSILFQLYFLSLLPSLSFIPFQILFTSFSFRCWQIRDFFFLFSSPRACFLYSTISLELVLSTVNILPLSFLISRIISSSSSSSCCLLLPLNPTTTTTILARNSPWKSLSIL